MARDCEKLSTGALEIFKKLEPFFPPDPWKNPQWKEEGVVISNWTYDLRKHADRERLEIWTQRRIGSSIRTTAGVLKAKEGSLESFTEQKFGEYIKKLVELLLILDDLSFQIETQDILDECAVPT